MTDADITEIFDSYDSEHTGHLSEHSFYQALQEFRFQISPMMTRKVFEWFRLPGEKTIRYRDFLRYIAMPEPTTEDTSLALLAGTLNTSRAGAQSPAMHSAQAAVATAATVKKQSKAKSSTKTKKAREVVMPEPDPVESGVVESIRFVVRLLLDQMVVTLVCPQCRGVWKRTQREQNVQRDVHRQQVRFNVLDQTAQPYSRFLLSFLFSGGLTAPEMVDGMFKLGVRLSSSQAHQIVKTFDRCKPSNLCG